MDDDKVVLKALDDLFVKDLTDLCIKKRFVEAEKVAQMRMSEVDAQLLVKDLREIIRKGTLF